MNKKDFYTFYFYTELIGTIIVSIILGYMIFQYLKNEKEVFNNILSNV